MEGHFGIRGREGPVSQRSFTGQEEIRGPDYLIPNGQEIKPQEGLGAEPLPKSRWCAREHQDPDSEDLHVYAPTPQSESIMALLQMIASLEWDLEIADAKNVFCRSDRLVRPKGSIFVELCEGLGRES